MKCDEVAEILNMSFNLMARDMYGATKKPGVPFGQQDAMDFAQKLQHDMRIVMGLFSRYGAYDSPAEPAGKRHYGRVQRGQRARMPGRRTEQRGAGYQAPFRQQDHLGQLGALRR